MSRFGDEEQGVVSRYRKNLELYPFMGLGLVGGAAMLIGRTGYYWRYGSKFKKEMFVLQTRIYTQGTFFLACSIPIVFNLGVYVSRKLRGLPTEKERKPLPPDCEYAPED